MTEHWRERLRLPAIVALAGAAAALAVLVGYSLPQQPLFAVIGVMLMLVGVVALAQPVLLPLLTMPLIVVVSRFGGGGVDMTISDWALGVAFWPAVLFAKRPFSRELRSLLWLNAVYQVLTLFTVIANPYPANAVEWVHAWLLVSGALVVGWAVGASGYAREGLSLFLGACLFLALPALAQAAMQYGQGNFSEIYPRWPLPMHKNALGCVLGFGALVSYARPAVMGWPRWAHRSALIICAGGIAVSQSRQALVALVIAIVVYSVRMKDERRNRVLPAIVALGALTVVATLVREQIQSSNIHNSFFQRLEWFDTAATAWMESPWVGQGLRYWYVVDNPDFRFQPPNGVLEVMAAAGVVGVAGFLIFLVGTLVVLWRAGTSTAVTLAFCLVLSRVIQGQLDLFWVSVQTSIPFLLCGLLLGYQMNEHNRPQLAEVRGSVHVS